MADPGPVPGTAEASPPGGRRGPHGPGGDGDPVVASSLVAACEAAWAALQTHHPDLPDAVVVLGTGVEQGRLVKLGHWWNGQWMVGDTARGEVLLAGEALHLPADAVFEVLAHEAAHGLNAARGVKDTSRDGRYHNARFKATAEAVGLVVSRTHPHGWAQTELGTVARGRYAAAIDAIAVEMRLTRGLPRTMNPEAGRTGIGIGQGDGDARTDDDGRRPGARSLTCGCGRTLRMARAVFDVAPVTCGRCGQDFRAAHQPERRSDRIAGINPAAATVDESSFLQRRRQALDAEPNGPDHQTLALDWLTRIQAAIEAVARHDPDPDTQRMLEAFQANRSEILSWIGDVTTADVVPLHAPPGPGSASAAPRRTPDDTAGVLDLDRINRALDARLQPAEPTRRIPATPEVER